MVCKVVTPHNLFALSMLPDTGPVVSLAAKGMTSASNLSIRLLIATLFEEALRVVLAQGGDTLANGACAGALLGCLLGSSRIPDGLLSKLPPGWQTWLEPRIAGLAVWLS
ncbi:hypothetical protein PAPYR_7630 [Paratrimastix pyriformis]|uniref:Uncharacterized protein n=1 Tax=Paratrimastix pyriformis TaxID=342808 RepID=A0ABQ8UGH9_9EUKA|nr:hypothetical protein PAPYR_7630 [Paratrimastix pyriformis]